MVGLVLISAPWGLLTEPLAWALTECPACLRIGRYQPEQRALPRTGRTVDEPGTNGLVVPRAERTGLALARGNAATTGGDVSGGGRQVRARSSDSRLTFILQLSVRLPETASIRFLPVPTCSPPCPSCCRGHEWRSQPSRSYAVGALAADTTTSRLLNWARMSREEHDE